MAVDTYEEICVEYSKTLPGALIFTDVLLLSLEVTCVTFKLYKVEDALCNEKKPLHEVKIMVSLLQIN